RHPLGGQVFLQPGVCLNRSGRDRALGVCRGRSRPLSAESRNPPASARTPLIGLHRGCVLALVARAFSTLPGMSMHRLHLAALCLGLLPAAGCRIEDRTPTGTRQDEDAIQSLVADYARNLSDRNWTEVRSLFWRGGSYW